MTTATVTTGPNAAEWVKDVAAQVNDQFAQEDGTPKPRPIAVRIPDDGDFNDQTFIYSESLIALAKELRAKHKLPTEISLDVLWKRKGGKSGGTPTYSKANLTTSGLLGYYAGNTDVVIWLAADHCRERGFTTKHIRALLYHELLHITYDDNLMPTLRGHDFAGFLDELREYGAWDTDLGAAKAAFEQAKLW